MAFEWYHSPGAPSGIGPIGAIAPAAQAQPGRIVGLVPALHALGDLGGPAVAAVINARKRTKEFNDAEGFDIAGASRGKPVRRGPPRGPRPADWIGHSGMLAALAAAANGQPDLRAPHLVARIRGVGSTPLQSASERFGLADPQPNPLSHDAAEVILSGLSYSHRAGTARLACEQVFDPKACKAIDWLAGKTGTPTFPNDDRSLDELWRLCGKGQARTKSEEAACGPLRPYKWYVAAYRTERDSLRWTKVIAVLTERNWLRDTGRIHGAGDHGPNPAAEIAMQIAGRHAGYLPNAVP